MSGRKHAVGDVRLSKHCWQIFNDNYDVTLDGERRERSRIANHEKPWAVYVRYMVVNEYFATHAEALAYALSSDRVAA